MVYGNYYVHYVAYLPVITAMIRMMLHISIIGLSRVLIYLVSILICRCLLFYDTYIYIYIYIYIYVYIYICLGVFFLMLFIVIVILVIRLTEHLTQGSC